MDQPSYLPTPAEIQAGCEKIRAGWSRREERRRRFAAADRRARPRVEVQHWTAPMIHVDPVVAAALEVL